MAIRSQSGKRYMMTDKELECSKYMTKNARRKLKEKVCQSPEQHGKR